MILKREILNIIKHFSEKKAITNKSKVPIFLICLSISLFIWLMIKMSQDYTKEIIFPISYSNPPQEQILTKSLDTVVLLKLNSRGFDLMNLTFFKRKKTININLAGKRINKNRYSLGNYILTENIKYQIRQQIDFTDKVIEILPDTLHFILEDISTKEIKVISNIEYSLKTQHQVYGDIHIYPESVIISGPPSLIDTITSVKTSKINFNELDKSVKTKVHISPPISNNNLNLSHDSVEISIPIEKFTEGVVNVPIEIKGPPERPIKLFPENAKITYLIALKDFTSFKTEMISAGIQFDSTKKWQNIKIFQQPSYIKITNIHPQSVEHLFLK